MFNYSFKRIRTEKEKNEYQKKTGLMVDVFYPREYLDNSKIIGLYHREKLIGGFLIAMQGEYRSLSALPDISFIPENIDIWDIAEVGGLWLDKSYRRRIISIFFWLKVVFEIVTSGKKYITYTFTTHKMKLRHTYSRVKPITLYEGQTPLLEGMKRAEIETIQLARISSLIMAPLKNPGFFINRFVLQVMKPAKKVIKLIKYSI